MNRPMHEAAFMAPLPVSVIIPCFNALATIERALASVTSQSRLPNEIILVDDASTDGTTHYLAMRQQEFPEGWLKIITLSQNSGPSIARNTGWEAAASPYIAFLDADDSWHPSKLEMQYRVMLQHPDIALTGHRQPYVAQPLPTALPASWTTYPLGASQFLRSNRFTTSSVMLLKNLPQRFEVGKHYLEDQQLWLEILLAGHQALFIDLALAAMYKPVIGVSGLSSHFVKMSVGELNMYHRLYQKQLLSTKKMAVLYSPLSPESCHPLAENQMDATPLPAGIDKTITALIQWLARLC